MKDAEKPQLTVTEISFLIEWVGHDKPIGRLFIEKDLTFERYGVVKPALLSKLKTYTDTEIKKLISTLDDL